MTDDEILALIDLISGGKYRQLYSRIPSEDTGQRNWRLSKRFDENPEIRYIIRVYWTIDEVRYYSFKDNGDYEEILSCQMN